MKLGGSKKADVVWLQEVGAADIPLVGSKGASLGELANAHVPIPPAFIVTSEAYFSFIRDNGLDKYIAKEISSLDPENSKKLNQIANYIQKAIKEHSLPRSLVAEIQKAYDQLGGEVVAIRPSVAAEDLLDTSFVGQRPAFLSVEGHQKLIKGIQECWASLFEAQAIYYRMINKLDHTNVGIAVVVQKMVESEASGIISTVDPNRLVIEAGLGMGEAVISNSISPDHYVVNKASTTIISKEISPQGWQIVHSKSGNKHVNLTEAQRKTQKLTDEQIIALAKIGQQVENHCGAPQDIEWAMNDATFYIIQTRPTIGVEESLSAPVEQSTNVTKPEILVSGVGASIGMRSGPVKIIHKPNEIDKVMPGDVLVIESMSLDYIPAVKRAAGIVTDTGGRTSEAASISRELGIPYVAGAGIAMSHLKTGQMVTVDGTAGKVYKGVIKGGSVPATSRSRAAGQPLINCAPITATKIYLNLAGPEKAEDYAALPVDGVGLLRAELIIAEIGEHPKAVITAGRSKEYVEKLAHGIATVVEAFHPRPVIYRFTNFTTSEYRALRGGEKCEGSENNPLIGCRGASRYVAEPEEFALEVEAIKIVRDGMDLKNLHTAIPFVRTIDEFRRVRDLLSQSGLRQNQDFKLWITSEVPSMILEIDKYIEEEIDGVLIDVNSLTQLILGIDRESPKISEEFNERYPAVIASMVHVVKACRSGHVTCSVCDQGPNTYPEIVEALVGAGATSLSLIPDAAIATRKLIASIEKKIVLSKALDN